MSDLIIELQEDGINPISPVEEVPETKIIEVENETPESETEQKIEVSQYCTLPTNIIDGQIKDFFEALIAKQND